MSQSKIFLLLLISFIVGIGAESFIAISIIAVLGTGLIAMVILAYGWNHKKKYLAVTALVLLAWLGGVVRMQYATQQEPRLDAFSHHHITVMGTIAEDPKLTERNQIILLDVEKIGQKIVTPSVRISVILRKYPAYQRGDILYIQGMFEAKPYNGITNGTLFSSQGEKIGEKDIGVFLRFVRASKQQFNAHIDTALPEPHAGFMKGLLLGERASMPPYLIEQFKQAGVSHIVALSGYNITLVGTFFVEILLILTVPFRATFWIAGSSIVFFVLLTGAQASLVRAAIMGILVLIAAREGRMYHMTNALVFAGMVMLSANPYLLRFDVGFQLSFLATLGLIYLTDPVYRAISLIEYNVRLLIKGKRISQDKEHRVINGTKKIMSETIAAQLAVLPLIVYLFGGISLIAPISNLFVLIAIPITMAFGFLTGVAGFIWQPLSIILGWGAWVLLAYELAVINFFSQFPLAFISLSSVSKILVIAAYAVAGFTRWRKTQQLIHDE